MGGAASAHVVPVKVYLAVFSALMVLTTVTVAAARFDLGALNTAVALGIAFVKATLVALYFMHLRWAARLNAVAVAAGLACLFILVFLTMGDYASRDWFGPAGGP